MQTATLAAQAVDEVGAGGGRLAQTTHRAETANKHWLS